LINVVSPRHLSYIDCNCNCNLMTKRALTDSKNRRRFKEQPRSRTNKKMLFALTGYQPTHEKNELGIIMYDNAIHQKHEKDRMVAHVH